MMGTLRTGPILTMDRQPSAVLTRVLAANPTPQVPQLWAQFLKPLLWVSTWTVRLRGGRPVSDRRVRRCAVLVMKPPSDIDM